MIHQTHGVTFPRPSEREIAHANLSRLFATEGIVLLKNEETLPLPVGPVALYGNGARMTTKGGTGSGEVHARHTVSIEEGLLAAGYTVTTGRYLDDFDRFFKASYDLWYNDRKDALAGIADIMTIVREARAVPFIYPMAIPMTTNHLPVHPLDKAIYVISRQAGEGHDRFPRKGDFLLSDEEVENLAFLQSHFARLIIIINTGGVMDPSFITQFPAIKAVVFMGQPGMEVGHALADVISGQVTPSGKLSATWAQRYEDYPNASTFSHLHADPHQENYLEDIYVGYRYFDTFHKSVAFPFGFGLSYTTFSLGLRSMMHTNGEIILDVDVANTGHRKGKEVVQVYVSLPEGGISHEYQRLVAFAKTKNLHPGEQTIITLRFAITESCTVYDASCAAMVLLKGDYQVHIGPSSKDTETIGAFRIPTAIVVTRHTSVGKPFKPLRLMKPTFTTSVKTAIIDPILIDSHDVLLSVTAAISLRAHDSTDPRLDLLSVDDLVNLVVGSGNQSETMIQLPTSTSSTCRLFESHGIPGIQFTDGPAGLKVLPEAILMKSEILKPIRIPRGKGNFMDLFDDAYSSAKEEDGVLHGFHATAWPVATVLAQTWNVDFLYQMGRAVGVEMREFGTTVWLGPAMNIHRNPLCGRNFEYYSEDPMLSGLLAAAVTQGVQEHPYAAVALKHFAANNQDEFRQYSSSNLSERALREIYLKGFEIAVKHGHPRTIMSSYNLINGIYTANRYDLLTTVLRHEWGFTGMVMSDWDACGGDRADAAMAIAAGNDLIMPGNDDDRCRIHDAIKNGTLSLAQLKRAASRVLGVIAINAFFPMDVR